MKKIDVLLTSFLILIIVVFVTFFTVTTYDRNKRDSLFDDYFVLQQKIMLDDIFSEYTEFTENVNQCDILNKQIDSSIILSQELLEKLKTINQFGIVTSDNRVKYVYILSNIKLWLQQEKFSKQCDDSRKIVLYFYPEFQSHSTEKVMWDTKTVFFEKKIRNLVESGYVEGTIALPYLKEIPIINQMIEDFQIEEPLAVVINDKVYYDEDVPLEITQEFLDKIDY